MLLREGALLGGGLCGASVGGVLLRELEQLQVRLEPLLRVLRRRKVCGWDNCCENCHSHGCLLRELILRTLP